WWNDPLTLGRWIQQLIQNTGSSLTLWNEVAGNTPDPARRVNRPLTESEDSDLRTPQSVREAVSPIPSLI
ncbi:hypothetical protein BaRGS_00023115, partial [Batillaria attramentaria]